MQINWDFYWNIVTKIGSRYYLIAGLVFFVFYVLLKQSWAYKKLQTKDAKTKDFIREILYSSTTVLIFGLFIYILHHPAVAPYTTRYLEISERGWVYYFAVFPVLFFMHDTYFYFTHRAMHHPALFKWFHLVHHQSTNPSPWAAYAFHPLEAIVEQGIVFIFYFTLPIHITHLALFFLFSIVYNIYGHLGYELYPRSFATSKIGKWINTSTSHNQHHQYFKGNYGLYLLVWDRVFGTIREDYDQRFEEVTTREKPTR
ncbi:MAG: sterol desaturase [Bacteroidetes bacterium 24-39-8]|jgi:sterol desaturase/sphingolipid hydroxylase (fatty acid hydroxylase superfamily)|nr:MAG: sterol desaturase [Sphingobacteriia bacterium 35-40-8]OYZ53118.1 MAG: sterol desaturase [Bacteroidetes bacterium 24-39-8]OZA69489.1 MAG: sterol desaturase [Sphingobacteriia bacterium 39-39-8]HQR93222.1 sterol desaturase family protein [Sediminibacterium sp.]HQS53678.1 sterol desaturase family protein [Sediminibacterium sp.]